MINQIAFYQNRSDEEPNIRLAEELAQSNDKKGITEIIKGLDHEDEHVANDCIKVLYEVGYRKPELIAPHFPIFMKKIKSRNNRMAWGACIALSTFADLKCDDLYAEFDTLLKVFEKGSVIMRDNCISIFAGLIKGNPEYAKKNFPIILSHLRDCRPKEVAQHAERILPCITKKTASEFRAVLLERYQSITDAQKKRIDKVLKKLPN
jgi:hypothetical protein